VSSEDYLELGFSKSDKKRDFSSTPGRFIERGEVSEFQTDSNGYYIGDISTLIEEHGEALTFQETPLNNGANIKASVAYQSSYAKVFLKPYENIEMIAGVRHADITQETNTIDPEDPANNTSNEVILNDYFPSFSLRYMYDEKNHFDFAVSETYIMPDLIEFADAIIVAPTEKRIDIKGNPELEPTTLKTFDIKYSYYFNESEYLKIGSFYKDMKNPIEDAEIKSASDGVSVYTFMNSDKAEVYGVELDGRKGLGFLHTYLSNFYISGNYTYLSSEVTLTEEQALRFTTNNRELQGLSPHIVNLALEYESDERTITLAYNKMWERIRQIGYKDEPSTDVLKGIPDTYEIPPSVLDLVWNEKFSNGLSLKLKLGNLLDEETVWYKYGGSLLKGEGVSQDYARENFITDRYKEGREVRLSVTYEY
jgi:TonB-dependent receptor